MAKYMLMSKKWVLAGEVEVRIENLTKVLTFSEATVSTSIELRKGVLINKNLRHSSIPSQVSENTNI